MSSDDDDNVDIEYTSDILDALELSIQDESNPIQAEKPCCHYFMDEMDKIELSKKVLCSMANVDLESEIGCLLNVLNNICSACEHLAATLTDKNSRYSIIDNFMKFRHDILHHLATSSLQLPKIASDDKFSEKFDFMDSNRTPDRIIVEGEKVVILETTATLNVFKGYISKGKIEEGFKSKYEREIYQLEEHGFFVEYFVLCFDVKDITNSSYQDDLNKISSSLGVDLFMIDLNRLEMVRCLFCNFSTGITRSFLKELTNLLTEKVDLPKPSLPNLDFLLVEGPSKLPTYKRQVVSTFVYNKMSASWPILPIILERNFQNVDDRIIPILEHSTNKFSFIKDKSGVFYNEMMEILKFDDKVTFSKMLRQYFDGRIFSNDRADIEYFDVVENRVVETITSKKLEQSVHMSSKPWLRLQPHDDYEKHFIVEYYTNLHHKNEDPEYERKLLDNLSKFYDDVKTDDDFNNFCSKLIKKPFSYFSLNESVVDIAVENFNKRMLSLNKDDEVGNVVHYQKKPFLNPLIDVGNTEYIDYRDRPKKGLEVLQLFKKGPYTTAIQNAIIDQKFVWGSRPKYESSEHEELRIESRKINKLIYDLQMKCMREKGLSKIPKIKDLEMESELRNKMIETNRRFTKIQTEKKNLSQVRLPSKKNNLFRKFFDEEMEHFKKKKSSSVYKGVGILDYNKLFSEFSLLKVELKSPIGTMCQDQVFSDYVDDDVALLKQLKVDTIANYKPKLDYLRNTGLYHSCAFVSKLCHTLAFYSQTAISGDYVSVDNLGYDNVILMIKGGKKIFKTKKSKLFRLMYPVHSSIKDWYYSGGFGNSNEMVKYQNQFYLLTSWHSLDEVVLNDGLTFLHRVTSYILLSHEPDISLSYDKAFFNIMLAFHARRKTEELLHNVRYICVNSISSVSRIDLMLPELAGFNYDFFQAYIRGCLKQNYGDFAKKMLRYNSESKVNWDYFKSIELSSIFDDCYIESLEDLTMTIYSTFLMSKSPTNQALEQVKNLRGMFKTLEAHSAESNDEVQLQYVMNDKKLNELGLETYWNSLFESDFNFDSTYCNMLGKFSADYLNNITEKGELESKWLRILNENWNEFANTKGLRGNSDDKFFNRKGYYVVYQEILTKTDTYKKIKDLLKSDLDDFKKRKMLKDLNQTYKSRFGCKNMKMAIFHVVDKKQRGGSREIFVMDLETKINQQCIEKFLAYICKKIPNEAISVPSNRRLQHIHANVFEKFNKSDLKVYNLTLDCRKWAPHSVINKFIDLIIGMSDFLPHTFITHFLIFFSKMFNKRVYTRKSIKDIMLTNNSLKSLATRILKDDENKKGAFFTMSYSWVMGIFNYMSSFMHVMNQLHISHIIMKVTTKTGVTPCHYHMNAHSDDSGGKIQVSSELDMKKTFFIYELLLKSCNHLLSDKKCNISLRYFEFLSVLYISGTLLSLITKLSGSFVFHPTDTGYCGDINECYSKTIELISSGATFEQAYLAMKISSHSIFKFYFNREPAPHDHKIPPQLLGIPDSHPLIVLLSGSESDLIRLTCKDNENFNKFCFLSNCYDDKMEFTTDVIKPIKASPNIQISEEIQEHQEILSGIELSDELTWLIRNTNLKNTGLQLLKYGLLLRDKKFIATLIDETITRRISRAYFFRSANIVHTPWGLKSYKAIKFAQQYFFSDHESMGLVKEIKEIIDEMKQDYIEFKNKTENNFHIYEILNSEVYEFVKSLDKISYNTVDITTYKKTCKPIHMNIQKTGLPTSDKFNPADMCLWIKFENHRWLLDYGDDYNSRYLQIKNFLDRHLINIEDVSVSWLFNLLQKFKQKYVKEYFIYSNVPHNIRDIVSYKDLLNLLSHNSFKNKVVEGITLPFGSSVSHPMRLLFKNVLDNDTLNVITFINYCFSIIQNIDLFKEVADLNINSSIFGCKETKLYNLITELISIWELKALGSEFVLPHLESLRRFMDHDLNSAPWLNKSYFYCFTKSQRLVGNVWLGFGSLYVNLPQIKIEFKLQNMRIIEITCNKKSYTFSQPEISYINSVLISANLPRVDDILEKIDYSNWEKTGLGINSSGTLSIDQCRNLKLAFTSIKTVYMFGSPAAHPEWCNVKLMRNFSYKFTHSQETQLDRSYNISVLKVEPDETLELLTKMYDSEKNRAIVEDKGEFFKQYMRMFIGVISGVELRISLDTLFDLFQSTKIYNLIRTLVHTEKITTSSLRNRKHIYPGQDGGLLASLIDYKIADPSFDFEYNLLMSPEMMSLKSSQPEIFISTLLTNINEKFNALYGPDEKEGVRREILRLAKIIDVDEFQQRLMHLLTTWGYIGVMGSINELNLIKKTDNYLGIRLYTKPAYVSLNKNVFKTFINALVSASEKFNYTVYPDEVKPTLICHSSDDFKKCLISYVHSHVLSIYENKTKNLVEPPIMELLKIRNTLDWMLTSAKIQEEITEVFQEHPMLSLLPVSKSEVKNLIVSLETLTNSVLINSCNDVKLNFDSLVQHDHELRQPYVVTKETLEKTKLAYRMKVAYHHGFISRERYNSLNKHKIVKHKNSYYDMNLHFGEESEISLDFNKSYFIKNKLRPEVDDDVDELYDLQIELKSSDPDLSAIDDVIDGLIDEDYFRRSRIRLRGEMLRAKYVDAHVFLLPNLKADSSKLKYIRNAATTLVLITNAYINDLIETNEKRIEVFHFPNDKWENKSLIDPDCLLAYVLDYHPIDIELWEKTLNAVSVSKENICLEFTKCPKNIFVDENGEYIVIDKYADLETNLKLLESNEELETEQEPETSLGDSKTLQSYVDERLQKLKDEGFDDDFISDVRTNLLRIDDSNFNKIIENMINNYIDSSRLAKVISDQTKQQTDMIIQNLSDVNQATKIFEVAEIFSTGQKTQSERKNRSLKDKGLRAEINALAPKAIDHILSGTLSISDKMKNTFIKQLKAMTRWAKTEKNNREKKYFLIDLSQLILNDAYNDNEKNNDDIFLTIIQNLTDKIIVEDEEEENELLETYKKESKQGKVYYTY